MHRLSPRLFVSIALAGAAVLGAGATAGASRASATGEQAVLPLKVTPGLPDAPLLPKPADAFSVQQIIEIQQRSPAIEDIWRPAPTPRGGVSWSLLETTVETTRTEGGIIYSRPVFPSGVRALAGKRIVVAGYMVPLDNGATQRHFALMAYPPGCPFHFHALPNQFIEVYADTPVRLNESDATTISGVLELTGEDESGIFFRLRQARAE
jgi:hypothetical protein